MKGLDLYLSGMPPPVVPQSAVHFIEMVKLKSSSYLQHRLLNSLDDRYEQDGEVKSRLLFRGTSMSVITKYKWIQIVNNYPQRYSLSPARIII